MRAVYVCRKDWRKTKYGCPTCLPLVSEGFVKDMENLVHKYQSAMTEEGIETWATCGTLLGIVRNIGQMPWDDDADFAIRDQDLHKFKKINWSKYGLKVMKKRSWYKVYASRFDGKWVDVFVYEPDPDNPNMWRHAGTSARRMWPKETFDDSDLFPLQRAPFGPTTVFIPNHPHNVIKAAYSEKALSEVKVKPMHAWTALDWPFTLAHGSFKLKSLREDDVGLNTVEPHAYRFG
jgi:phosphorylcholine metabolism protein LicD